MSASGFDADCSNGPEISGSTDSRLPDVGGRVPLDRDAVLVSVVVSLCAMPVVVYAVLTGVVRVPLPVPGALAMVPGVLPGGTALWVAARD